MVILRPTRKLHSLMPPAVVTAPSDTALGDWYVNRLVIDRQPLLLLVSSESLLPILLPARDARRLPARLGAIVETRLLRLGIDAHAVAYEREAMFPVTVAPTVDRSVLGILVDFAKAVPFYLEPGTWTPETLTIVEDRLAETPCRASLRGDRVIVPDAKAPELLRAKWLADGLAPPTRKKIVLH
jgi:hypothetical protein